MSGVTPVTCTTHTPIVMLLRSLCWMNKGILPGKLSEGVKRGKWGKTIAGTKMQRLMAQWFSIYGKESEGATTRNV